MAIPEWVPTPEDVEHYRADYRARVDADADVRLAKFVTVSPVRVMVYDRKVREALQAIDDPNPTVDEYPLLAASILHTNQPTKTDFDVVCGVVIGKELETAQAMAAIERLRLITKRVIADAVKVDAIIAAYNGLAWPEV